MSFASYLLSAKESVNEETVNEFKDIDYVDESGFFDGFGVDKIDRPSDEGLAAAMDANNKFAVASDGQDTDVNLSINDSYPKEKEIQDSVQQEANTEIPNEPEFVDPATVPNVAEEDDQWSEPNEGEVAAAFSNVSVEDLAKDDDVIGESFTGWDDLL